MALEDLHAKFMAFTNPEPDATPDIDAVMAGVTEVYNSDIAIRDAAVAAREAEREELKKENALLKQKNYDLIVKQPAAIVTGDSNANNGSDEDKESERAATITINDLFEGRQ